MMAVYHKHLEYHDDVTKKRPITNEEISFLKELQKEMNTQNTVGQADPRFWVIKGSKKEYGIETGYEDGSELVTIDGDIVATDMKSAAEYIKENLLHEINDFDGIDRRIEVIDGIIHPCIRISWRDEEIDFDDFVECENMDEVVDWLNEFGYEYRAANYLIVPLIYPDTMFLTQKAAENHLRANDYHYSDDAHTYAMTSWRNSETEKLWKILQETDWDVVFGEKNDKEIRI